MCTNDNKLIRKTPHLSIFHDLINCISHNQDTSHRHTHFCLCFQFSSYTSLINCNILNVIYRHTQSSYSSDLDMFPILRAFNMIWASWWDYGTYQIGDQRRLRRVWKYAKGVTEIQTSIPAGWLRMRVCRMSLRRTKGSIISWAGSIFTN